MHVTEVGACNLIEQRNQETAASYSHSLFDSNRSILSHLFPYSATRTYTHAHIRHPRRDGLRQRQTTKVILWLAY